MSKNYGGLQLNLSYQFRGSLHENVWEPLIVDSICFYLFHFILILCKYRWNPIEIQDLLRGLKWNIECWCVILVSRTIPAHNVQQLLHHLFISASKQIKCIQFLWLRPHIKDAVPWFFCSSKVWSGITITLWEKNVYRNS